MLHRLSDDACRQIKNLLWRCHTPIVIVRSSSIVGAGQGIFAAQDIPPRSMACLYPGIYTPGFPSHVAIHEGYVYLAKEFTPSGFLPEHNPYVLNLKTTGGYLDGKALHVKQGESGLSRRLDDNPSACGHLVNHSCRQSNAEVVSFKWRDVLGDSWIERVATYDLPNSLRADGSPWYLDDASHIARFHSQVESSSMNSLCGAAIRAKIKIEKGAELFFDYNLKGPVFPAWASSWYSSH